MAQFASQRSHRNLCMDISVKIDDSSMIDNCADIFVGSDFRPDAVVAQSAKLSTELPSSPESTPELRPPRRFQRKSDLQFRNASSPSSQSPIASEDLRYLRVYRRAIAQDLSALDQHSDILNDEYIRLVASLIVND